MYTSVSGLFDSNNAILVFFNCYSKMEYSIYTGKDTFAKFIILAFDSWYHMCFATTPIKWFLKLHIKLLISIK